jgi:hypothetical protein
MVILNINDFQSGEFAIAFNQNAIPDVFNVEKTKEIITKAFGKTFADDYFKAGNENKYDSINDPFSFENYGATYYTKGLKYMIKCFLFSEIQELLAINQTDSGAVLTVNEPNVSYNKSQAAKYNNRGVNEKKMLADYIEKEFKIKAKNDFYKIDYLL